VNINKEEKALLLSALRNDTVGTHGDGRQEAIDKLMKKIKREEEK